QAPATKQFLEEINKWTVQYNVSPLSWNVAVKFLMARKFDVLRAIELFHSYRETRRKEGIVKLKPHEEPLRSEILSGKFTILNVRDPTGASIALFTARLHHPHKSVQHVVLQALFYLLDRAVDSFETQRNGLVFIYDMCGSNYANFELDLGKKVLNLLKGAFPARLKKVLIVGAPIWFRVPYSIISLLLKDKVRERIQILKTSEVTQHLPRECLPENLGGYVKIDLATWNFQFLPQVNGHPDPFDEIILFSLPPALDWDSVHVPGPHAMTIQELVDYVNARQKQGIYEEYEDIRRENPVGTFHCSMSPGNLEKNRYGDVPCLDQTRVKLTKRSGHTQTDYINASFMDGYKQKNAYIGTQGPLENTYRDFWLMVWEQKVLVICGQYWPLFFFSFFFFFFFFLTNLGVENIFFFIFFSLFFFFTEVTHFHFFFCFFFGFFFFAASLIDFFFFFFYMGARSKGLFFLLFFLVFFFLGIGRTGNAFFFLEELGTLFFFHFFLRFFFFRAFSIQTPFFFYFFFKFFFFFAEKEGMVFFFLIFFSVF
uniref:Protein tyrosine phosphatase non-receptor type 9 n=1 Tax=Cercocebus atys TaxID=9531 RepID=A0A2K5LIK5_CERAT